MRFKIWDKVAYSFEWAKRYFIIYSINVVWDVEQINNGEYAYYEQDSKNLRLANDEELIKYFR